MSRHRCRSRNPQPWTAPGMHPIFHDDPLISGAESHDVRAWCCRTHAPHRANGIPEGSAPCSSCLPLIAPCWPTLRSGLGSLLQWSFSVGCGSACFYLSRGLRYKYLSLTGTLSALKGVLFPASGCLALAALHLVLLLRRARWRINYLKLHNSEPSKALQARIMVSH